MKSERISSHAQVVVAMLLIVGMYLPSSTDGEHSRFWVFMLFAALISLLGYLAWNLGVLSKAVTRITLPILIVLLVCTFVAFIQGPSQFDFGMFVKFSALAMVLCLDLRRLRPGRLVYRAFVLVNCISIALGTGILVGSDWATEFVTKYYWSFYPGLVPAMLSLHKPVLMFGSHSVAAFFFYLFFWVNWKDYELRRRPLALFFALGNFILLLGLTSFTSVGFGALALVQMSVWLWGTRRKLVIAGGLCLVASLPFALRIAAYQVDQLADLPRFADGVFLNSDLSGPLARYGLGGELRMAIIYLLHHPLSPIGFTVGPSAYLDDVATPSHFFIGDSGPLEYLLRGSVPLLFLIYFGLYKFLRQNLMLRNHAWGLFLAILLFESGFSVLGYPRTYYLLPFFVIYLNGVASSHVIHSASVTVGAPIRYPIVSSV